MATVPSQQTFSAGATLTAAQLNDDLRDAVNFLLDPPSAKAYSSTVTNHNATGAANFIVVGLNSESWDNDTIHDNVTNNSRLTCKTAGRYLIIGNITFAANATGTRAARIQLGGATDLQTTRVMASPNIVTSIPVIVEKVLAVNDYVELLGAQNSGGNLDMNAGDNVTWLQMRRIGPS